MQLTFTRALVRPPTPSMTAGLTTQNLGTPIYAEALKQHTAYVETLRSIGLRVHSLRADDQYPDACFIEDTAVLFGDLVFITQPGAPSRRGEVLAVEEWYSEISPELDFVMLGRDEEAEIRAYRLYLAGEQPVTPLPLIEEYLDGGDVLICTDQTGSTRVMIGIGQRTNLAGANRLRDALLDHEPDMHVSLVPFAGMLHLKSGINDLAPGVLLLAPELEFDAAHLDLSAFAVHTVPPAESYAANVVVINDHVSIPAGFPTVAQFAAQYYDDAHIHALNMSEFAKIDGGLTCLSLRY